MNYHKYSRVLTLLLAIILIIGAVPISAAATADISDSVTVIIKADTVDGGVLFRDITEFESNDSPISLLEKAISGSAITITKRTGYYGEYVSEVTKDEVKVYKEFGFSSTSGWMYTVDGSPYASPKLGSEVVFYYTYKGYGADQELIDNLALMKVAIKEASDITSDKYARAQEIIQTYNEGGTNKNFIDYADSTGGITKLSNEIKTLTAKLVGSYKEAKLDDFSIRFDSTYSSKDGFHFGGGYEFYADYGSVTPTITDVTWVISGDDSASTYISGDYMWYSPMTSGAIIIQAYHQDFSTPASLELQVYDNVKARADIVDELMKNIAASYVERTDNSWIVTDMGAYAGYDNGDATKISEEALQNYINVTISGVADKSISTAGNLAKAIISFKAHGLDATKMITLNKTSLNAVDSLKTAALEVSGNIYALPWVLIAYEQDLSYATESEKMELVYQILNLQDATTGGWGVEWGVEYGVDATGPVLAALAFYRDDTDVGNAIIAGVKYLYSQQAADGSFSSNANSSAMAAIGLAASGREVSYRVLDGLLSYRTTTNDGFEFNSKANESATQQGFEALVAIAQSMKKTGVFNVYDFSANSSSTAIATGSGTTETYTPKEPNGSDDITVNFTLMGDTDHGDNGAIHTYKDGNLTTWIPKTSVTLAKGATAYDAFVTVLNQKGYTHNSDSRSGYIYWVENRSGVRLAEIGNGALSGWMYHVNRTHPDRGSNEYTINNGDNIVFHYTDDFTQEEGSEQWSGTALPSQVMGSISKDELNRIAREMASGSRSSWTIFLPKGDLTLDSDSLAGLVKEITGDSVTFSIETVNKNILSSNQQEKVGDRPVYDITIKSGGKTISQLGGTATISIPYTLKENEQPTGIVVYHLDSSGNITAQDGTYNPATGKVTFTVDHLSYFMIGYDEKLVMWPFTDVAQDDSVNWYYGPVKFVYERGIFSGMSATTFEPNRTMTRAMLVSVLARMNGVDLTTYSTTTFDDVDASAWYAPAVAWAKEAGIVSGYNNSDGTYSFRPTDVILRQDMAVMIQNFLLMQNGEDLATTKEAIAFRDEAEIASYAKMAVASMQKAGIISGVQRGEDAFFLPRNTAKRAEAAVMIWQALQNK